MTDIPQIPVETRIHDTDTVPINRGPHARRIAYSDLKAAAFDSPTLTGTPDIGTPTGGDVSNILGGLGCIEFEFVVDDFTPSTTTGILEIPDAVPVGARLLNCSLNITGPFTGDVSATIQVGDGTDVDRFNTGTPSVFTTGHKDMGAVSGTAFVAAAIDPVITITSATDFALVIADGNGAGVLRLNYLQPASEGAVDEG